MKDEIYVLIKCFVGLKAKMYTYITEEEHECKNIKGINNSLGEDQLKCQHYKNVMLISTYMNMKWV